MPVSASDDRDTIRDLILSYGARLDGGYLEQVAELFVHATYRTDGTDVVLTGSAEVLQAQRYCVKIYEDGTPSTHHNITNIRVELEDGGTQAGAWSYYTVIHHVPGEDPKIILTGRYEDRFENREGQWCWIDHLTFFDQVGDLSKHLHMDRIGLDF